MTTTYSGTQRPTRKGAKFFSKHHGKSFSIGEVLKSEDLGFLQGLLDEVDTAARDNNFIMSKAKKRAAAYGHYLKPEDFEILDDKRRALAEFQQPLQRCVGNFKKQNRTDHAYKLALRWKDFCRLVREKTAAKKWNLQQKLLLIFGPALLVALCFNHDYHHHNAPLLL
jgi:hypothetical protein